MILLIAKVICRANDREDARARLERALRGNVCTRNRY
jgi:acetyl/propionyl-CoA carboxylase alpha subunit